MKSGVDMVTSGGELLIATRVLVGGQRKTKKGRKKGGAIRFIRVDRSMGVRVWSLAVSVFILFFVELGARPARHSLGRVYKK